MTRAEVVDGTNQIHAMVQCGYLPYQGPPTANQSCNSRSESGVQSLNVGGVDHAAALGLLKQGLDLGLSSLYHPAGHTYDAPVGILFDYLGDGDIIPRSQPRASDWPRDRFSEGLANRVYVRATAIHTDQQRTTQRTATYPLQQCTRQMLVTVKDPLLSMYSPTTV
jgi:hypothetical protein